MIYLARHGETTWNLASRYQGRLESALTALGVRQGFALADYFFAKLQRGERVPERIIASPLLRCTASAQFTATRLDVPLEIDNRLIEIAHGAWEGRYGAEVAANDAERYREWREHPADVTFPGGEGLPAVLARWRDFAASLAGEKRDTLVVTHDAVIRCALLDCYDRPLAGFWQVRMENCAFARLEPEGGRLAVREECV